MSIIFRSHISSPFMRKSLEFLTQVYLRKCSINSFNSNQALKKYTNTTLAVFHIASLWRHCYSMNHDKRLKDFERKKYIFFWSSRKEKSVWKKYSIFIILMFGLNINISRCSKCHCWNVLKIYIFFLDLFLKLLLIDDL